jgi:hypothetical protein
LGFAVVGSCEAAFELLRMFGWGEVRREDRWVGRGLWEEGRGLHNSEVNRLLAGGKNGLVSKKKTKKKSKIPFNAL